MIKRDKRKSLGILTVLLGTIFVLVLSILLPKVNLSSRKSQAYSVLNFPDDHGSHPSFNAEWWYLNLLTRTTKSDGTDQRDLAYVLSFSRILGSNNLLSSRYDNTLKSFKESTEQAGSLVVQLKDGSRLFIQFSKGLVLTTLEELATGSDRKRVYHLTGRTANVGSFDLTLKERTVVSSGFNTPLLWGGTTGSCQGKISVFAQDDTYYYSVPDLDITGSITDLDGTRRNVLIGKAWIDHQWFNSSPPSDWLGHYWTNFHFTNSSDLYSPGPHQAFGVVTQIYSSGSRYTYWVKRNAHGTNECGTNGTVVVKSYGSTNYPNSWTVNNGSLNTNGYSFSDNQIFQPPIGPKFIEAASYYSGNLNGIPFTGLGFFETHLIRPSVTPTPRPTPTPPLGKRTFTVEALLRKPDGSQIRFTKVNAYTIVRYLESNGDPTKPRICYQGNNDGQCQKKENCMENGIFSKIIAKNGKPCDAVKPGYYSTHWLKKVDVDGKEYTLIYPNKNCTKKLCTQEEFINKGHPYHYAIYALAFP